MTGSIKYLIALLTVLGIGQVLGAEDSVYPSGSDYICRYQVSPISANPGDTITIIRDFINEGTQIVNDIYFSEHLPNNRDFEITGHSVTINGYVNEYQFYKEVGQPVINGYNSFYWVLDTPDQSDSIQNVIYPGDSIRLSIEFTVNQSGQYNLSLHTAAFMVGSDGYFATGDGVILDINSNPTCGDVNYDNNVNILDLTFLIAYLYQGGPPPNPFNIGDVNGSGDINILDLTYLIGFLYQGGPDLQCP